MTEDNELIATRPGQIVWHSSEEGGGPDVGMTLGLGGGALMWIGERTEQHGGGQGLMIYSYGEVLVNATLDDCEEMVGFADSHLAPMLTAYRNHEVEL